MKFTALAALLGLVSASDITKAMPLLGHKGENPADKIKLSQIVAGTLEPFVGNVDPMALMVCVLDIDEVLLTLDAVVHIIEEAIQTKQYPELLVAALTLGGVYKEVQQALIPCSQIHPQIDLSKFEPAMKILEHPVANLKLIEDDLKLAGVSIIDTLKSAAAHYKAGEFEAFGKDIGTMLKAASEGETAKQYDSNTIMAAEMTQGFFEATNVGHINIDALLYCIYDVDNTAIAAYLTGLAIKNIWRDRHDPNQAFADFIIAGTGSVLVYEGVKQAIAPCEAIPTESLNWTDFDSIISLTKAKQLEENLASHKEDLLESVADFMAGKYHDFGYKFGAALMPKEELFLY